jgi:hypothetical protein
MVDVEKITKIAAVCTVYMIVGPMLILVNKYILKDLGFRYPMFLSGLGMLTTALVANVTVHCGQATLKQAVTGDFWLKKILPVGAFTAMCFTFGNAAYMYLTVAFIQMLKAFTPAMVMLVLYCSSVDIPTKRVVQSVMVICLGTAISSYGEMHMVWIGFLCMALAETAEACRLALQQWLLKNLKFGVIEGQYYMAPASALCIFLGSAIFEAPSMIETGDYNLITKHWVLFLLASTLGLAINLCSFLVISLTSGVTIKILGTVRNALLVVFTVVAQGEVVSKLQFIGYMVTLLGFAAYNYYKMLPSGPSSSVAPTSSSPSFAQTKDALEGVMLIAPESQEQEENEDTDEGNARQ